MSEQEIRLITERMTGLESQVMLVTSRLDDFIQEMRDRDNQRAAETQALRNEMIERDNRRAEEIQALRSETDAKIGRIEQKIDKLDTKIDGMGMHVRNLSIAAMAGIAAMVLAVVLR